MILSKEDARDSIYGDLEGFKTVLNEIIETGRWSIIYDLVIQDEASGKFYESTYSCGATEMQDESPFEYDGDEIEFTEVEPVEVIKIEYRPVKE